MAPSRLAAGLELDDLRGTAAIDDHVHDLDSCALEIMHEGVHPGGKVRVSDRTWNRDRKTCGRGEQALIDPACNVCGAREAALRRNVHEGIDQSSNCTQEADQ